MFSKEFWSSLRSPYCKLWCRNVHQVCVQEGNYRGFNQDFPIEVFTSALYSRKRRHGSFLVLLSFFGHISVVYTFVLTSSVEYGVQNTHEFSRLFFYLLGKCICSWKIGFHGKNNEIEIPWWPKKSIENRISTRLGNLRMHSTFFL